MAIEDVVRPAQAPTNQPAKTNRQRRTARNWNPVVYKIGVGGSLSMGSSSISQTVNYYHKRRPQEKPQAGSFLGITWP